MNVNPYIGIPYKDHGASHAGVDCYGLLRLWYKEQRGVDLPDYGPNYDDAANTAGAAALMAFVIGSKEQGWWRVPEGKSWQVGDALLLRVGRWACHCGIYLGADFLHSLKGRNSTLEALDSLTWRNNVVGAYRWTGA